MNALKLSACVALFYCLPAVAQDFTGYRNGNYAGVNGVFYNPANIADSRYRWDFNLFSLSTYAGNNNASFSLKNLSEVFNSDDITDQVFGAGAAASTGLASVDLHGPSLMFNTGKKMSFALTTRARVMANVIDIDGQLVDKVMNDISNDPSLPYAIESNSNMRFNVNAWTEYAVNAARVIKDEGKHFVKAGVTLKYLTGAANAYLNINNLRGTINEDQISYDAYLANTTGRLGVGIGGVSISDFEIDQVTKSSSTGFGATLGLVYELRPSAGKFTRADGNWKRDMNKYKLKVGLALHDLGKIKYNKDMSKSGDYDVSITGNERLYFREFDDLDVEDYNSFFATRPQFFTPAATNTDNTYGVSLPSTLQLDVDYNIHRGFYVSLASQFSLVNNEEKAYNSAYFNFYTLTPRYEGRGLGLYFPLSYNKVTNFNAGASLRLGPLFVGSGSLFTALFGNSKQADVHIGFRIGGLQKNLDRKEHRKKARELERANKTKTVSE